MKKKPWILGISMSHNGSACLLRGDEIVVAIQEERLSRKKHDFLRSPNSLAVRYCLEHAGISRDDLDLVVGSSYVSQRELLADLHLMFPGVRALTMNHHMSHAVGAFATSGFSDAAILVVDGCGSPRDEFDAEERSVTRESMLPDGVHRKDQHEIISLYRASGAKIVNLEKHVGVWLAPGDDESGMLKFGSLGGLFASAAKQIFGKDTDAGKVMGLAPYGRAQVPSEEFLDIIDGHFAFRDTALRRFSFTESWPEHQSEYEILAASVQAALEKALGYLGGHLETLCPSRNLVFSGGVALNSVANEKTFFRGGQFENVYIMPSAEDSGNSIGAAYYGLWQLVGEGAHAESFFDGLGRQYSSSEIDAAIAKAPNVKVHESSDAIATVVDLLTEGKIVGWFQGRSELGPRALGQRSILCDPRRPSAKAHLNRNVKHREGFRPFAPVVPLEEASRWFELGSVDEDSPYMLRVCRFQEDKAGLVPGVVHVDDTGRLQTVTRERNGKFYDLVRSFFERTGVPVILNTSFNVMGEPIVETPEDALWCLIYTGVDYCFLEDRIVTKAEGHESILDLRPHLEEYGYERNPRREDKLIAGWEFVGGDNQEPDILFSARNRWGTFEVAGEERWLSLLALVDGSKNGWELLDEFGRKCEKVDEFSFLKLLGELKRSSLIGFS